MARGFSYLALVVAMAALTGSCATHGACDFGACDPVDSGSGFDGGFDAGITWPMGCEPDKEPKDSPKCVDESVGIFVSTGGADGNDGTRARPVRSIGKALAVRGPKPRIYVCEGDYEGAVDVGPMPANGGIFGGWACGDWSYHAKRAAIAGAVGSITLRVRNAGTIAISDVDVTAPDATAKGGSSIAGWIANSTVTLRRTSFAAGKGQPGSDEATSREPFQPAAAANGNSGAGTPDAGAGAAKTNEQCASTGGQGGAPGASGNPGTDGAPRADVEMPSGANGKGGTVAQCSDVTPTGGRTGSHGSGGEFGASARTLGAMTETGFVPAAGEVGHAGSVGQGGGGGASTDAQGGGGGGGPGGCPGAGGAGGGGGGASIALGLVNAQVIVQASTFTAREAGRGGNGGVGQVGQAGGSAGGFQTGTNACAGGRGGAGGSGGGGGGGAGGISVGILWVGAAPNLGGASTPDAPTYDGITVSATTASGGEPGAGGAPIVAAPPMAGDWLKGKTGPDPGKAGMTRAIVGL